MNQLMPENTSRKLDNLGRITLPKGLRDRMYLSENSDLEIFTAMIDGRRCIVLTPPIDDKSELEMAFAILKKNGIEVKGDEQSTESGHGTYS